VNNVRSDVNRSIWRLFREHEVIMPVAQREVVFQMKESRRQAGEQPRASE